MMPSMHGACVGEMRPELRMITASGAGRLRSER